MCCFVIHIKGFQEKEKGNLEETILREIMTKFSGNK